MKACLSWLSWTGSISSSSTAGVRLWAMLCHGLGPHTCPASTCCKPMPGRGQLHAEGTTLWARVACCTGCVSGAQAHRAASMRVLLQGTCPSWSCLPAWSAWRWRRAATSWSSLLRAWTWLQAPSSGAALVVTGCPPGAGLLSLLLRLQELAMAAALTWQLAVSKGDCSLGSICPCQAHPRSALVVAWRLTQRAGAVRRTMAAPRCSCAWRTSCPSS